MLVPNRQRDERLGTARHHRAPTLSPHALADDAKPLADGSNRNADVDRARRPSAGRMRVRMQHDVRSGLGSHEVSIEAKTRFARFAEVLRRNDDVLLVFRRSDLRSRSIPIDREGGADGDDPDLGSLLVARKGSLGLEFRLVVDSPHRSAWLS